MIIEVRNVENNELIINIKARSNTKNIHDKVRKELSKMVGNEVKLLMQGKIDMRTGIFDGCYLTLGTFRDVEKVSYNIK